MCDRLLYDLLLLKHFCFFSFTSICLTIYLETDSIFFHLHFIAEKPKDVYLYFLVHFVICDRVQCFCQV